MCPAEAEDGCHRRGVLSSGLMMAGLPKQPGTESRPTELFPLEDFIVQKRKSSKRRHRKPGIVIQSLDAQILKEPTVEMIALTDKTGVPGWRKTRITWDTDAGESVCNTRDFPKFPVQESEATRKGV